MQFIYKIILFIIIFFFSTTLFASHNNNNTYTTITIDSSVAVGNFSTGIDIDSNGGVGICYYDRTNYDLKYAYYAEGEFTADNWTTETVDNRGDDARGMLCAIKFDSDDNPNIVYLNDTSNDLLHAEEIDDSWVFKNIDTDITVEYHARYRLSMDIDSSNNLGVAYYDATDDDLKYAFFNNGTSTWSTATVVSTGDVGRYPTIAFDSNDKPAIIYMDFTDPDSTDLEYIYNDGSGWSEDNIEEIDNSGYAGFFSSIKFDSQNRPHIVYRDNSNSTDYIKYTIRENDEWATAKTLDTEASISDSNIGLYLKMIIDNSGNAHFVYTGYSHSIFSSDFQLFFTSYFFVEQNIDFALFKDDVFKYFNSASPKDFGGTDLVMDNNNNTYISWTEQASVGGNYKLCAAHIGTWQPAISVITPNSETNEATDSFDITWYDFAPDSNAEIRLYYSDYRLITDGINENDANSYTFDTSSIPRNSYYIYARISHDDFNSYHEDASNAALNILNHSPSTPTLNSPQNSATITSLIPTLSFLNSTDVDSDAKTYNLIIYSDEAMSNQVLNITDIAESESGTTTYSLTTSLADNSTYYWRTKAIDSEEGSSSWTSLFSFTTDINDAPTCPTISTPTSGSTVTSLTPTFIWTNATDADGDTITYSIQVCSDANCASVVYSYTDIAKNEGDTTSWQISDALTEDETYYILIKSVDPESAESSWTDALSFNVNSLEDQDNEDDDSDDDPDDKGTTGGTTTSSGSGGGCSLLRN